MAFTRKSEWKQANPRDQVIALLSSVEGHLSNALGEKTMDAHASFDEEKLAKAYNHLRDAQMILKYLPSGEWP